MRSQLNFGITKRNDRGSRKQSQVEDSRRNLLFVYTFNFVSCKRKSKNRIMNDNDIVTVDNYISGKFVPPSSGEYLAVQNPANDCQIGKVGVSCVADVESGVAAAESAFPAWSKLTIKARAAIVSFKKNDKMSFFDKVIVFSFLSNLSFFSLSSFFLKDDEIPCTCSRKCRRACPFDCFGKWKEYDRSSCRCCQG